VVATVAAAAVVAVAMGMAVNHNVTLPLTLVSVHAQVFITGASNGGSMALRAVCELGGSVFAGAAFDVASLENVRGDECATRCLTNATGDSYVYW
jgi:hypothetical protein